MTIVFYTYFTARLSDERFVRELNAFPSYLRERIRAFKRWQDSFASLYGKLLLLEGFRRFGIGATLNDLMYTKCNKPYLKGNSVCFNISHSGSYVVCAMSDEVDSLGVDVEKLTDIDINDFQGVWTQAEWKLIVDNGVKIFYEYWTRKEAVLKAEGSGLGLELGKIDVRLSPVELNEKLYFIKKLALNVDYVLHLAADKNFKNVDLMFLQF